jgi:hypothetical protein
LRRSRLSTTAPDTPSATSSTSRQPRARLGTARMGRRNEGSATAQKVRLRTSVRSGIKRPNARLLHPSHDVPVGPRHRGRQRTAAPYPDCEFDFVNGVTNSLFQSTSHQHRGVGSNHTTGTLPHFPSSFLWIKEALYSALTAVIPVLLPLRAVVPELADPHREERVHSNIQPVPYDLCTHSEQERDTISKRQGDLVPVPCCCRGTAMCN